MDNNQCKPGRLHEYIPLCHRIMTGWQERTLRSAVSSRFFAGLLLLLSVFPFLTIPVRAETVPTEQNSVTASITPIPRLTPSWQHNFRPRKRDGYMLGKYIFIDVPAVSAGLKYEFQDETRTNNGVDTTELYHKFAEKIGFRSKGWIYHPALCSFTATLEPELSQVYEEDNAGRSASDNLFTPDYLLNATFLNKTPYTLNLHANRREMPSWAPFKGGFENRTNEFGGDVVLDLSSVLETTANYYGNLGYNRYDSSLSGFYQQDAVNDTAFIRLQQQGGVYKTDFETTYSDELRTTDSIEQRTKTLDSSLINNYTFRDSRRIVLDSHWTYRNQELDTTKMQNFRINESLHWQHRKTLSSYYRFNYTYQDSDSNDGSHQLNLEGRLRHLLFDNLTSSAGAASGYRRYQDGQEMSLDPYLRFLYNRPTPIGPLSLGLKWDYLLTSRDFDNLQSDITVQNELHQLNYAQDSFLDNYGIDTGTIIVTNRAGTIRYIEGIDYQLEVNGDYVSIRSLSLGDIDNGQEVLVHYRYNQDSAYDDGIFRQHYNLAYTFLGNTRFQVTHSRASQTVLNGIAPRIMVEDTMSRASVQHSLDWSTSRLEMTMIDRSLSNLTYNRWQASQRFSYNPIPSLTCSLAGYYGETNYDNQPLDGSGVNDVQSWGGTLGINWNIGRGLAFNLEGFTNRQDSDIEEDINTGIRSSLTYTYRIWSARLSYQFSNQSFDNESGDVARLKNYIRFDLVRLYW